MRRHTLEGVKRYWPAAGGFVPTAKTEELAQKLRGNLQAILKMLESHSD